MKKGRLLVFLLVILSILVGSAALGIAAGNGPVKFRGAVITPEQYGELVCYGSYYSEVAVEEILEGHSFIQGVGSVEVCYGQNPLHFHLGQMVEVYGYYYGESGLLQYMGRVVAHGDSYYINPLNIRFKGTAIDFHPGGIPGAPYGWTVSVDELISGPQPCSNQLFVWISAVWPSGYIDSNIKELDQVEVFGSYDKDQVGYQCSVSLIGSTDYYIKLWKAVSLPSSPTPIKHNPVVRPVVDTDPLIARPFSFGDISSGIATVRAAFPAFEAPVDIYLAIDALPYGALYLINESGNLTESTTPWQTNKSDTTDVTIFEIPVVFLIPGDYRGYTVVVPAGADPATFDFKSSAYYMWYFDVILLF